MSLYDQHLNVWLHFSLSPPINVCMNIILLLSLLEWYDQWFYYIQVVGRPTLCNHYLSELSKTLSECCINLFTEVRDLNCGLAILKSMEESFSIFWAIESKYILGIYATQQFLVLCTWLTKIIRFYSLFLLDCSFSFFFFFFFAVRGEKEKSPTLTWRKQFL